MGEMRNAYRGSYTVVLFKFGISRSSFIKRKAAPLHAMKAPEGRGGKAPTDS
jgi:hypothetical protein